MSRCTLCGKESTTAHACVTPQIYFEPSPSTTVTVVQSGETVMALARRIAEQGIYSDEVTRLARALVEIGGNFDLWIEHKMSDCSFAFSTQRILNATEEEK